MTLKYNMKFFYTKLVNIETLISNLDELDLSAGEKAHLANLVDSSLHSAILDEILSNLSPEDKKLFLVKLETEKDHDKILEFLNEKIDNVEDRVKKVSDQLITELHEDLKQAKEVTVK